ncbi:hypothetical protein HDK77DRAFT_239208 [Phyllosticta capitalensis]|uniref:PHD-type domain-containing protein n=1 Tax=Phyllosticta capitalensis TaxID=121624 RepID=A0ABR1YNS9_9PEZI
MNLDQQRMYGITDWRLPSPSSTPKSATFSESLCYTPRTDAFQSHFFDAWSTPRANVQQTPTRTPLLPKTGTIDRPLSCSSSQNLENPGFHFNHYSSTPNLPLPPVDPSRRLASSPGPLVSPTDPQSTGEASNLFPVAGNNTMGTPQIQTPPPTRDASSARARTFDVRNFSFNTPSAMLPRRDSAPATSTADFGQRLGPPLFPNLQLSLETNRYGNVVPTRAPVPPQPRFLWEQNSSAEVAPFGSSASDDPFGFTPSNGQSLFSFQGMGNTPNASRIDSSSLDVSGDSWTNTPSLPMTSSAELQKVTGGAPSTSCLDDPFVATTSGVDPNMLFSFAGDSLFSSPLPSQTASNAQQRQPYEQKLLEAGREKTLAQNINSQQYQVSSASTLASTLARPGLQRSNTHSGLVGRSGSADGRRPLLNEPPRRNSPLKRGNQTSLTAISEHAATRPKTRLVVDQHGNARTETIRGEGSPRRSVDHRTRYSGLWEDDSDSDRGSDPPNPGQYKSMQGSSMSRRNSGKSRVGSFLSRSQTTKTLRSSSIGSFTGELSRRLGRLSTETTPSKLGAFEEPRRDSVSSQQGDGLGELMRNDGRFLAEGRKSEDDDAQNALKRMLEETKMKRQDSVNTTKVQTLEAHNERWKASADMCRRDRNQAAPLFDPFSDDFSLTPTSATASGSSTLFSPTTDVSSGTSDSGTRCVCNSTEWDGQLMVQCESCNKWQHAQCMGLPPHADALPSVYVCVFCTGSTPVARGGRIRDPFRLPQAQLSPLSHKSTLRR